MAVRKSGTNPTAAPARKAAAPPRSRPPIPLRPVPMPKAPTGRRDTRTFRRGTKIPGSDLALAASIRTVAHKLPRGYGIDAAGLTWAYGDTWDEAMRDFLTDLRDALASLSRMESQLHETEQARLRRLRASLGRQ